MVGLEEVDGILCTLGHEKEAKRWLLNKNNSSCQNI